MLYCTIFYQRKMSRKLMCERQIFSPSLLYCHSVKDSTYDPNSLGILLLNTMALFFSLRRHKLANRASVYQEPCKQGNWTIKFLEPVDVFSFNLHKQFYKTTLYSYLAWSTDCALKVYDLNRNQIAEVYESLDIRRKAKRVEEEGRVEVV